MVRIPTALHSMFETLASSQAVACFSDMAALDSVAKLAGCHDEFGLGFTDFGCRPRGSSSLVPATGSEVQTEFYDTVRELAFRRSPEPDHPLWRMTPFIDSPREPTTAEPLPDTIGVGGGSGESAGGSGSSLPTWQFCLPPVPNPWLTDWWKQKGIEGWGATCLRSWRLDGLGNSRRPVIPQGSVVVELDSPPPGESSHNESDTAPLWSCITLAAGDCLYQHHAASGVPNVPCMGPDSGGS